MADVEAVSASLSQIITMVFFGLSIPLLRWTMVLRSPNFGATPGALARFGNFMLKCMSVASFALVIQSVFDNPMPDLLEQFKTVKKNLAEHSNGQILLSGEVKKLRGELKKVQTQVAGVFPRIEEMFLGHFRPAPPAPLEYVAPPDATMPALGGSEPPSGDPIGSGIKLRSDPPGPRDPSDSQIVGSEAPLSRPGRPISPSGAVSEIPREDTPPIVISRPQTIDPPAARLPLPTGHGVAIRAVPRFGSSRGEDPQTP